MAAHSSDTVTYFLHLDNSREQDLANIRSWPNLEVAREEDSIWVSQLTRVQVESLEVKSLPFKRIFTAKDGKLYPLSALLPEREEPMLTWQPIARAIPLKVSAFNHNFFGFLGQFV